MSAEEPAAVNGATPGPTCAIHHRRPGKGISTIPRSLLRYLNYDLRPTHRWRQTSIGLAKKACFSA